MFIAQELRKKSIAEYLLYMWQVEDLIRAYGCSLSAIKNNYISRFDYSDEQKEEMTDWYGDLIRMINQEGKREKGHLQINAILVDDLTDLHARLLQSPHFPFYNAEYYKVLPFIVELRGKGGKEYGEIETCLNATANYDLGIAMDEVVMDYITTVRNGTVTADKYGQPAGRIHVLVS